ANDVMQKACQSRELKYCITCVANVRKSARRNARDRLAGCHDYRQRAGKYRFNRFNGLSLGRFERRVTALDGVVVTTPLPVTLPAMSLDTNPPAAGALGMDASVNPAGSWHGELTALRTAVFWPLPTKKGTVAAYRTKERRMAEQPSAFFVLHCSLIPG